MERLVTGGLYRFLPGPVSSRRLQVRRASTAEGKARRSQGISTGLNHLISTDSLFSLMFPPVTVISKIATTTGYPGG